MALHSISLCAGVGGLDLGVELAAPGTRTICFVEWEAYTAATLVARMEDSVLGQAPVWDDATSFSGTPWRGCVDLITAGYPCQPFSVAGKRKGADDPRHLWPHVARIIREVQPRFVFLENVGGHLRIGGEEVVSELEQMGYSVALGLFTAEEVGAPHKRERLFILAHRNEPGLEGWRVPERKCGGERATRPSSGEVADPAGEDGPGLPGGTGEAQPLPGSNRLFPPNPNDAEGWGRVIETYPELAPAMANTVQPDVQVQATNPPDRAQGRTTAGTSREFPTVGGQEAQPPLCRVADGMAYRVDRLRCCGNGVVPLQAAYALMVLADALGVTDAMGIDTTTGEGDQ